MPALSPDKRQEWFVGAVELAMLDLLRQEYVDNEDVRTLFIVDFPRMAQAHCVPPLHLSMVETTGLLPAPTHPRSESTGRQGPPERDLDFIRTLARRYPLTLGLTEVLSRFVFDRAWSSDVPKLMLSTQTAEAASMQDAMRSQSLDEWRRSATQGQIEQAKEKFREIRSERGTTIEEFVASVANEAEKLLPAIYGEYSQVRQFLRLSDIAPTVDDDLAERPVAFAHIVKELRGYIHAIQEDGAAVGEFNALCKGWDRALPDTFQRSESDELSERMTARKRADAETLATIEYLNDCLLKDKINCRVVFISDDRKIFAGALARFGERRLNFNPRRAKGSAQGFDRGQYNAHILRSPLDHGLRKVPILDPRALLTGRRFVDYAIGLGSKESDADPTRAITEWLPVFFDGRERDKALLARAYTFAQSGPGGAGRDVLKADDFQTSQYEALEASWGRYIRTVGTAHGLIRYSTRIHLREIFENLIYTRPDAVENAIRKQLDHVMSAWLPAVAGATLARRLKAGTATAPVGMRSRGVPPLVLPAMADVQRTLTALLGGTGLNAQEPSTKSLAWITKPTAQNLGLDSSWNDEPWKLHYLQALGLAYGFAIEENWSAAYRLSSAAFSLAQVNRRSIGEPDVSFVSGREAAFLASVTARRSLATRPVFLQSPEIERNLINQLQDSLELERPFFRKNEWSARWEAHGLRLRSEKLAWETYRLLYLIMRAERGSDVPPLSGKDQLDAATQGTLVEVKALRVGFALAEDSKDRTGDAYFLALSFAGRQLLFSLLQLEVFGILSNVISNDADSEKRIGDLLIQLAEFAPSKSKVVDCKLDWSGLEEMVISKAIVFAKKLNDRARAALKVDLSARNRSAESAGKKDLGLTGWRLRLLYDKDKESVVTRK